MRRDIHTRATARIGLLLLAALLIAVMPAVRAAEVIGDIRQSSGAARDAQVQFIPLDTPKVLHGQYISSTPTVTNTVQGRFRVRLVEGAYRYVVASNARDSHDIYIADTEDTIDITTLLTNVVYTYRGPGSLVKVAADDAEFGYLQDKLIAGTNTTVGVTNIAGVKKLVLSSSGSGTASATNVYFLDILGAPTDNPAMASALAAKQNLFTLQAGTNVTLTTNGSVVTIASSGGSGSATNVAFADVTGEPSDNPALLLSLNLRQPASEILTNWSVINPVTKQNQAAILDDLAAGNPVTMTLSNVVNGAEDESWSFEGTTEGKTSTTVVKFGDLGIKQDADADLTSLAGGITGLVKGSGNGNGFVAAVSADLQATLGQVYQGTNANLTLWGQVTPSSKEDAFTLEAGSNITLTTNGTTVTVAGAAGGGSTPEGTMVNTGTPAIGALAKHSTVTGTNLVPTAKTLLTQGDGFAFKLEAGSTNVVDFAGATIVTNLITEAIAFACGTNGLGGYSITRIHKIWNVSGSDVTFSVPSTWATNAFSPVPPAVTNGWELRMIATAEGETGSSALQTNIGVAFQYRKLK